MKKKYIVSLATLAFFLASFASYGLYFMLNHPETRIKDESSPPLSKHEAVEQALVAVKKLQDSLNDPASTQFVSVFLLQHTDGSVGKLSEGVVCMKVRSKNAFGALVLNELIFFKKSRDPSESWRSEDSINSNPAAYKVWCNSMQEDEIIELAPHIKRRLMGFPI